MRWMILWVALGCGDATCPEPTVRVDGRCVFEDAGVDAEAADAGMDASTDAAVDAVAVDAATDVELDGCTPSDETCNGVDDDCDGTTDEDVLITFYLDGDGDGRGDATRSCEACNIDECPAPGPWVAFDDDCDDECAECAPIFDEVCDGLDNDCDMNTDEDLLTTYYRDMDGDGFGDDSMPMDACTRPVGYAADDGDCADEDADAFPGQTMYFADEVEGPEGGYDYNCNTTEDREFVSVGVPECSSIFCPGTARWSGSAPPCGATGTLWFCNNLPAGCLGPIENPEVARCR